MSSSVLFLIACSIWSLFSGGSIRAEDGNQELAIVGEERLGIQTRQLRQIYPEVRKNIEDTLGWKLLSPPTVVLIADQEIFEKMSGSPLISAFALPSRHSIVIHLSSATSEPYMMHETFEHELCHLLLHDHIKQTLLPKWLDEGICQWISGSLGEIFMGKGVVTSGINLSRHPIPLQQLTKDFPKDKNSLIQAYEESRLFVEFLVARYGKEGLLSILECLKEGEPIDEAMLKAFSKSLETLQRDWLQELRGRSIWLMWVSQYLYEILFFFGALLTVVAFVRMMIRKRAYHPDEDDEE